MARSKPRPARPAPVVVAAHVSVAPVGSQPGQGRRFWVGGAVVALLAVHLGLAVTSLLAENPTVDEVAHLPAGVSYWQTGTFKLYHHNPPLTKLVAAVPVVLANPITSPLYQLRAWADESQATFGEVFAFLNMDRYLDLFARGRLAMLVFSVVGGLAVFGWSSRLYGPAGGLLSLTLWVLCPNILAHARLVTSDVAAAALGVAATWLFVRYLDRPTWRRASLAGVALGLAELTKFSSLLLYGFWPLVAAVRFVLAPRGPADTRPIVLWAGQGGWIVVLSVLVIDLGYGFEGVGQPLGRFEFASRALTVARPPGTVGPQSGNPLLDSAWKYRVNRFRGTILEHVPALLPRHYLLGFDEQKLETEGIPSYFFDERLPHDDSQQQGYSVYLNGVMRQSGWWYYYLATLAYKVPAGTWLLVGLGGILLVATRRSRLAWADEFAVLTLPVGVLIAISLFTDICLGIRYILPIFPFVYVATGKVAPWTLGLPSAVRRWAVGGVGASLAALGLATATIHPHYLAYFNQVAGGPDRGSEHLIDSNLDWGQDLVTLGRWVATNRPGAKIGLAYFGQINPSLLKLTGDPAGFDWFLPPADGPFPSLSSNPGRLVGPARTLTPGLYAVSASLVRGLPWRFHDSLSLRAPEAAWQITWRSGTDAFAYFAEFTPIARVGHSIFVYEISEADSARWTAARQRPRVGQ